MKVTCEICGGITPKLAGVCNPCICSHDNMVEAIKTAHALLRTFNKRYKNKAMLRTIYAEKILKEELEK